MEHTEVLIRGFDPSLTELLVVALLDLGYESFSEEEELFGAYIDTAGYDEGRLRSVLDGLFGESGCTWEARPLEKKNWNEEWEKNFEPVTIGGNCLVRAPFHPPVPGMKYDLVIEPKMSFGTAHHETTALMIGWMLDEPVAGKHVLDMGCGTGVLAILAAKMDAKEVRALDNDPWAFENARENCQRNNVWSVHVIHGDDGAIPSGPFDVILANINRNILVEQMPVYSRVLRAGGWLYVSGFYAEDLPVIRDAAAGCGFQFTASREQNRWMAAKFTK